MITLQLSKQTDVKIEGEAMTLYEVMQQHGLISLDITDKKGGWDITTCLGCCKNWGETRDAYDRLMLLFACNIEVQNYAPGWYTQCYIADFLWENRKIFEKFFNKHNSDEYCPWYYKEILNAQKESKEEELDLSPDKDTGFYESFVEPFISMIDGNYSEEACEELFRVLAKEALPVL